MLTDLEKKLIVALRSDDYAQAEGALKRVKEGKASFCCLGVGCDLSGVGTWRPSTPKDGSLSTPVDEYLTGSGIDVENINTALLPDQVRALLGWKGIFGELDFFDKAGNATSLASCNDSLMPFSQIADLIEAELVLKA